MANAFCVLFSELLKTFCLLVGSIIMLLIMSSRLCMICWKKQNIQIWRVNFEGSFKMHSVTSHIFIKRLQALSALMPNVDIIR